MSSDHALATLADLCGILPEFFELNGTRRATSTDTQRALLAANGVDVSSDGAVHDSLAAMHQARSDRWFPHEIIVQSQTIAPQPFGLGAEWYLCADGSDAIVASGAAGDHITLPPLPSGIYELTATAAGRTETTSVLVAPARLPSLQERAGRDRIWGMNAALYGLQSDRNSGMGDFEDLAALTEVAGRKGASFIGINPLHSMGFADTTAISPIRHRIADF